MVSSVYGGRRRRTRRKTGRTRRGRGIGSLLGGVADHIFGWGRRKRTTRCRTRRGAGVMDLLRKGHDLVKRNKIISRYGPGLLRKIGVSDKWAGMAGNLASNLGYGRRRRRGGMRRSMYTMRGGHMII